MPEKKGKLNQREPRFSAPRNSECSCAEGRRAEEPKSRRAEGPKITPARDDWSAGSGGNPYLIGRRVANAGGGRAWRGLGVRGRWEAEALESKAFPALGRRQLASGQAPPSGGGAPPRLGGSSLAPGGGPTAG